MTNDFKAAAALRQLPVNLVTTRELTAYLRCDRKTIHGLVRRGVIEPFVVGRSFRFDREQVVEALRRRATA